MGAHATSAEMRTLLLALLVTAPLSAQTVTGGIGVAGWGSSTEMLSLGGTATAPVAGWTVGVHGAYSEEIVLSSVWQDYQATGALLAGRSERDGVFEWSMLAGPSLTRALRQPNVSPARPSEPGYELGAMVRLGGTVTPVPAVPVGLSLDLGVNAAAGGVTTTVVPGLALRLGR